MRLFLEFLKIFPLWVFFAASLLQTGRLCLAAVRYPFNDECEEAAYSFGAGAVLFATLVWAVGSFIILNPPVVLGLSACFVVVWIVTLVPFLAWSKRWLKNIGGAWGALSGWEKAIGALAAVALAFTVLAVGSPVLGRDALAYHFYCPKWFLHYSSIGFIPYSLNALQPLLEQMLFLQGLVFGGESFAKLYNLGFLLSAAFLWVSAGRYIGKSTSRGFLAAALILLTPGWMAQTAYAYNDIALSFFLLLAFFSMLRFFHEKKLVLLAVSGFFSGAAAATKILALPFLAAMGLLLVWHLATERSLPKLRALMIYAGFLLLPCVGWYLRSYVLTGNPIFPYMNRFFTGVDWVSDIRDQTGIGRDLLSFIRAPFLFFLSPGFFGGGDGQPGILMLAASPLVFARPSFKGRGSVYFALGFLFLSWFFLVQHYRFILPAFALFALMTAGALEDLFRSKDKGARTIKAILLFLAALQCAQITYYNGKLSGYLSFSSKEEYLTATERSYGIANWVNQNVADTASLWIHNEPSQYYFNASSAREDVVRSLEPAWAAMDAGQMFEALKLKGFTHLLDREAPDSKSDPVEPVLTALLKDPMTRGRLELIHQNEFKGPEGVSRYTLYKLKA